MAFGGNGYRILVEIWIQITENWKMLNFSVGQWKQTAANIIVVILLYCLHLDCVLEADTE